MGGFFSLSQRCFLLKAFHFFFEFFTCQNSDFRSICTLQRQNDYYRGPAEGWHLLYNADAFCRFLSFFQRYIVRNMSLT